MGEQVLQADRCRNLDRKVRRWTPLGKVLVELTSSGTHAVSKRTEEFLQQPGTSPGGHYGKTGRERNWFVGKFLALFAATPHCGRKHLSDGHTQEGVRCIWTIIYVLLQLTCFSCGSASTSHQPDWIDLYQESHCAKLIGGLWIENVRGAE